MNHFIETQLAASAWGVRCVIDCCRSLSDEQFNRAHDIGPPPGSLKETLAHVVDAMFYFSDNFAGREYRERPHFAASMQTPDGLRRLLDEAEVELRSAVDGFLRDANGSFDAPVRWTFVERDISFAVAWAQVLDHATHHRVQCMYMLKRLGVDPLPEAFPLEWSLKDGQPG